MGMAHQLDGIFETVDLTEPGSLRTIDQVSDPLTLHVVVGQLSVIETLVIGVSERVVVVGCGGWDDIVSPR